MQEGRELQLKTTVMSSVILEDDDTPELVGSGERHASNSFSDVKFQFRVLILFSLVAGRPGFPPVTQLRPSSRHVRVAVVLRGAARRAQHRGQRPALGGDRGHRRGQRTPAGPLGGCRAQGGCVLVCVYVSA